MPKADTTLDGLKKKITRQRSTIYAMRKKLDKCYVLKDGKYIPYPDSITRRRPKGYKNMTLQEFKDEHDATELQETE